MKQHLSVLSEELARWRDGGLVLPIWWRDDDATMPTPALDRLLALAASFGAPVHLAVIPAPAGQELVLRLAEASHAIVLPHGWRHRNHAPAGEKKAEFGDHRTAEEMLGEVVSGWKRLRQLFGTRALPVFTPPWNRIAPNLVASLPAAGLAAISTFKARRTKFAAPGLLQVNTHVDPFDWQCGTLADPAPYAARIAALLCRRRKGDADANAEPFGILTHHLVHDERIWSFVAALLETLVESRATRFASPLEELQA